MSEVSFFVGIDLGNEKHAVCVLNAQRKKTKGCMVKNDRGLLDVIIAAMGDVSPASVHIALEDRNNVVVDALLAAGFAVFTANPKQVERLRDRESVAGAKDDSRDASVLANAIATDARLFRRVAAQTESEVHLKSLTSTSDELTDEHRRLSNQLRAVVLRYFPALLTLCEGADQAWFWALLLRLGDAEAASSVRSSTIAALLKRHRRRTLKAPAVVAVIAARHLPTAPGVKEAGRAHAASLIARLVVVAKQRTATETALKALLAKLAEPDAEGKVSDVALLLSMPGVGPKTVAVLLSECLPLLLSGDLERVRALSGVAPVTKQSGKGRRVTMRYACSERLRNALFHIAKNSVRKAGRFRTKYEQLIKKGHGYARALRGVADVELHVMASMLKNRTRYEERAAVVPS